MQVNEIFMSISGEVGDIPQGAVTWFIRFQGCNLCCSWCDTAQSQRRSEYIYMLGPEEIANSIPDYSNVVLTGGEPYLQNKQELIRLVSALIEKNCLVQIETNGSCKPYLPICHVFDYKTPSSGMDSKMMPITHFLACSGTGQIWIKFVIKNKEDLEQTIQTIEAFEIQRSQLFGLQISLSVESGEEVSKIINRMKLWRPDLLPHIVFNFQLHKHFALK